MCQIFHDLNVCEIDSFVQKDSRSLPQDCMLIWYWSTSVPLWYFSQHAAIWLGIFNDPSNVKEMVWFNSTAIEYNNFNSPTADVVGGMAANKTKSTDLCVYAEVTDNMIWKNTHCEEKLDFGCEISRFKNNIYFALGSSCHSYLVNIQICRCNVLTILFSQLVLIYKFCQQV